MTLLATFVALRAEPDVRAIVFTGAGAGLGLALACDFRIVGYANALETASAIGAAAFPKRRCDRSRCECRSR
jgi:enoyl-CoA hydratase/carnithine racemase